MSVDTVEIQLLVAPHDNQTTNLNLASLGRRFKVGMNALDEVPFQTTLGPLQDELQLVTAPCVHVPDSRQILRDTEVRSHFALSLLKFGSLVVYLSFQGIVCVAFLKQSSKI